jgi:archaellum biogenesis protein FlaJ (TadC family)
MKKLLTPDNYLTGLLVSAILFLMYFLITTTNSWKFILGIAVMAIGFSIVGYITNKVIEKISK